MSLVFKDDFFTSTSQDAGVLWGFYKHIPKVRAKLNALFCVKTVSHAATCKVRRLPTLIHMVYTFCINT